MLRNLHQEGEPISAESVFSYFSLAVKDQILPRIPEVLRLPVALSSFGKKRCTYLYLGLSQIVVRIPPVNPSLPTAFNTTTPQMFKHNTVSSSIPFLSTKTGGHYQQRPSVTWLPCHKRGF